MLRRTGTFVRDVVNIHRRCTVLVHQAETRCVDTECRNEHNEVCQMNLIFVFPCIIIYGFIRTSLMQIV